MEIEVWDPQKHLEMVQRWAGEPVDETVFPPDTWIVGGMVAGSLFLTFSTTAFVDNVITDPTANVVARGRAAHRLLEHIYLFAKDVGVKQLVSHSAYAGLAKVGRHYGLQVSDGWHIRGRI